MTRELPPCPVPGGGVHGWILAAANRCHSAGLSESQAELLIKERMTRRPSPANEVVSAIRKAYTSANWRPSRLPWSSPVPMTEIQYDESKLRAMADKIQLAGNWRHWLYGRSPKRPESMNPYCFLSHLYRPGEIVLLFDVFETRFPIRKVNITAPMDCRVSDLLIRGGRHGSGVWFLANPVDGEWHDTGEQDQQTGEPKLSCRNYQAITSWRYGVLESDKAPADLWLAFIAQLPIRIAAIYTSGGRSIHTLIRIDAATKSEWDSIIGKWKRPLKVLGGDAGCLSAVRLTRLPGCWRPEKNGFQKLLYLCPNPPLARLIDLPVLRTRAEMLNRWRGICRKWNPEMEPEI